MVVEEILRDAYEARHGIIPSTLTVFDLALWDSGQLLRQLAKDHFPALKPVLRLFDQDYHREPDPNLNLPVVFFRAGYISGASSFKDLGQVLEGYGINNHQYNYLDHLENIADRFTIKAEEEVKKRGRKICAVGHSKGALVILASYQLRPDLFERIVTLTPPFYGSEKGHHFSKIDSLYRLRPESDVIQRLSQTPLPKDAPILNLYTDTDEFIEPYTNSILPEQENIRNIIFPGAAHNAFLRDPIVHQMVKLFLEGQRFDNQYMEKLTDGLTLFDSMHADIIAYANGFLPNGI